MTEGVVEVGERGKGRIGALGKRGGGYFWRRSGPVSYVTCSRQCTDFD